MKKIIWPALFAFGIALGGCIKDKDFEANKYGVSNPGGSPVGVGFPQAVNDINTSSIENVATPQTLQVALVNLLSDAPAEQDIHVTIALNPALISEYNIAHEDSLLVLPANAFSIPSMTVVIPKGQRTATFTLNILNASGNLDLTRGYALGLEIKSVQEPGITIAGNLKNILLGIAIKNQYDGIYSMRGYTLRAGFAEQTGNFSGAEMTLVTAGVTTVDFLRLQIWADGSGVGIGNPRLTVNPATNKVTITSSGGASNLPGYDSRYDPATRTFFVGFTWGAGPASRVAIDTLVFNRPRP
jgi:hypothetical protein